MSEGLFPAKERKKKKQLKENKEPKHFEENFRGGEKVDRDLKDFVMRLGWTTNQIFTVSEIGVSKGSMNSPTPRK